MILLRRCWAVDRKKSGSKKIYLKKISQKVDFWRFWENQIFWISRFFFKKKLEKSKPEGFFFKGNIWYLRTLGLHSSLQFLLDEHRVLDWNKIVAWNVFKIVGKHCATRKDPNFFRRRLAAPHCETIISIGMFIFTKSLICF